MSDRITTPVGYASQTLQLRQQPRLMLLGLGSLQTILRQFQVLDRDMITLALSSSQIEISDKSWSIGLSMKLAFVEGREVTLQSGFLLRASPHLISNLQAVLSEQLHFQKLAKWRQIVFMFDFKKTTKCCNLVCHAIEVLTQVYEHKKLRHMIASRTSSLNFDLSHHPKLVKICANGTPV